MPVSRRLISAPGIAASRTAWFSGAWFRAAWANYETTCGSASAYPLD